MGTKPMGTKPSDEEFLLSGGSTSHCSQFVVRRTRAISVELVRNSNRPIRRTDGPFWPFHVQTCRI